MCNLSYVIMKIETLTFLLIFLSTILSVSSQENGKFLNLQQDYSNNLNEERRLHKKRKPQNQNQGPCSYGGYKNAPDGTGRTFFDFQLVNVGYTNTNNYNLNCGGGGGGVLAPLGNKPLLAGGLAPVNDHKPLGGHKPGHGLFGNHNGGGHLGNQHGGNQNGGFNSHFSGGGGQGLFANRPGLAGVFGNRPLQGLFGQSQSQSQSQSGPFGPPLQFPAAPQGGAIPGNPFNRPQVPGNAPFQPVVTPPPSVATPIPPVATTTDPDDIIFNDGVKPVHEDHDPIYDPLSQRKRIDPSGTYLKPGQYFTISHPLLGSYTQYLNIPKPRYFGYGRNAENALYDRRSISNTDLRNNAQISATQRVGSRNFRFPI